MSRKIVLALLLILNHSLLYGVSQAAYIPDAEHPYGHAYQHEHLHVHLYDHEPALEPELKKSHDHDHHAHDVAPLDLNTDNHSEFTGAENHHESQHTHGVHIQLNCDLPFTLSLTLLNLCDAHPAGHQHEHASLAFAPPVPPPNR